jgi:MFS family permease
MQIIGLGTLVMMPLIGNMSDKYGRKALLTVPLSLVIVPSGKHVLLCFSSPVNQKDEGVYLLSNFNK